MNRTADGESELSPVKRALLEIRELRAKLNETESSMREPIAIIGMGLRFPGGANDPESFWRLLRDGVDAIAEIPPDRWDANAYYDPNPDAPGKMSTRWGGFLKEVDKFDPEFFGISPREAVTMDPQQRLLLEVVWESLENSGQAPNELFGSLTGVFIGIATFDYLQDQLQKVDPKLIDAYLATGNTHSVASGRISYVLGLRGPSVSLDTACSSSLVAVHQACQSLRSRECNMALAGGVNVILRPEFHINFSKTHAMAADGRCKAFDSRADGFVRSEGCGIVVLKRLRDALRDADPILALIRGSAVNQDGRSSGLTAPNGPSQQDVIRKALANAGVAPNEVRYVEAHGTGTALGDPIEVQALSVVLGEGRSRSEPVVIGSVKTNIGHLEAAAGVAGLIKVILAFKHRHIPPHLHLRKLNPHISWENIPVTVVTAGMPWPSGTHKRIAGVSSFGFSGTNAHVVMEEAPQQDPGAVEDKRPLHLLALSAQVERALQDHVLRMAGHLSKQGDLALGDVAHTVNVGRSHFSRRAALIASTTQQAQVKLQSLARGEEAAGVFRGNATDPGGREVVFLFSGQGAPYGGMGSYLYETQPTFRAAVDQCAEHLRPCLDRPLLTVLFPEERNAVLPNRPAYTQPALFALEYALAKLWRSWGIEPAAVMGYSVGEYVAACVAGIFSLEEGLRLVAEWGRLIEAQPTGGMMAAVFTDEEQVRSAIAPYAASVSLAAINSPRHMVISGESEMVRRVMGEMEQRGVRTQQLNVSHAFHSSLMEPILDELESSAKRVRFRPPEIPLIASLTGQIFTHAEHGNAGYWRRHARESVRFAEGVRTLYERGQRLFLEMGPGRTLGELGRQCISDGDVLWLASLTQGRDEWEQMLESLAQLYVTGVKVDWHGFDRGQGRRKVILPTYPFQRERYWFDGRDADQRQPQNEGPSRGWAAAAAAGRRQSMQIPMDLELHTYEAKWRILQALTTAYIVHTLRAFGVFGLPGETHTAEGLLKQCEVLGTYRGLVSRWLTRLTNEGLLMRQGQRFVSATPLPEPKTDSYLLQARQEHQDIKFLLDYIERCGDKLGSVLTGRASPLETLFPGGSSQMAENLYQHWALSRYFNGIASAVVDVFLRGLPSDQKVRVLEIGAGTGGTTSEVLPVLPPDRALYFYTDVSEVFFHQAKRKFQAYPFIRYGALDIERNPRDQGYGSQGVDLVIAANVLHATRNLKETVQHVLSLLSPGGLLLLYEVTEAHPWFDTTVALIEGWQLFEDDLRKDGPLLTVQQWQALLRSQGFSEVAAFPQAGLATEILKAHVMMAQAPGSSGAGQRELPAAFADSLERPMTSVEGVEQADATETQQGAADFADQLKLATSDERRQLLVDYVRRHVTHVLKRDPSKPLNRHDRLMDLGVDSLMAVELRNRLGTGLGLGRPLPATLIFDYPTIHTVADHLAGEIVPAVTRSDQESGVLADVGNSLQGKEKRIEDLSDQEVENLVLAKLKSLE